jgi:uncharacterized ParB-like nuclease family protein
MEQTLKLVEINIYGGTQTRAATVEEAVVSYGAAMLEGILFPPIIVFFDGKTYWLADGFHRYLAAKSIEAEDILCEVREGSRTDALKFALGANATNGLYRTNADKRASVEIALEEWPDNANTVISDVCKVSQEFVRKIRKEVQKDIPKTVTGKDGKQYPSQIERQPRGESSGGGGGGGRPGKKKGEMGNLGGGMSELEQAVQDYARSGSLDFIKAPAFEASGAAKLAAQAIGILKEINRADANRADALKMVQEWIENQLNGSLIEEEIEEDGGAIFIDPNEED